MIQRIPMPRKDWPFVGAALLVAMASIIWQVLS